MSFFSRLMTGHIPFGCYMKIRGIWTLVRGQTVLHYKPFLFFYSYIIQYLQVFKYVLFGPADYNWILTPNSSLMVNKSCIHTQIFSLFINDVKGWKLVFTFPYHQHFEALFKYPYAPPHELFSKPPPPPSENFSLYLRIETFQNFMGS